ncbi:hypothetical protein EIN_183060 [Entamoeba invadens IP1]|uniref:hypothetical protein n=1 Tax=Entamoeba invadens IP1 TaxID=370355 RepID=UPI0002C3FBBD|nr:hypothetical protein EIN_183060 [Entamoeba invadens IP1]ELP94049.1 hypothetical protein EIN_183060 [Entamoeba invadens IP1]|eukprot:XP_004260820.1 hypothetical protein EIN_183060 [Entamoeba invadens IP1]
MEEELVKVDMVISKPPTQETSDANKATTQTETTVILATHGPDLPISRESSIRRSVLRFGENLIDPVRQKQTGPSPRRLVEMVENKGRFKKPTLCNVEHKKRKITQCGRCQQYGHNKQTCPMIKK